MTFNPADNLALQEIPSDNENKVLNHLDGYYGGEENDVTTSKNYFIGGGDPENFYKNDNIQQQSNDDF